MVKLLGTSTSTPSTMSLTRSVIALLRRRQRGALHVRAALPVIVDAVFDLGAEMADQALDRPRSRIAQRADRMPLDLGRHVQQRVDLGRFALALHHPLEYAPHPARAFAARRALAAALVLVEVRQPRN